MNAKVDDYIAKSTQWPEEIRALRPTLLRCGLVEEIKWAKPCYSYEDKNILILQEMKHFLAVMFFKGALLSDPNGLLKAQGPNSRSARRMTFTSVDDISRVDKVLAGYIQEAIDVEQAGLEVGPAPEPTFAEELQRRLDRDPEFTVAFNALTPGRRREYNLYFSSAKQSKTREDRIEKYAPKILAGKGFRDR